MMTKTLKTPRTTKPKAAPAKRATATKTPKAKSPSKTPAKATSKATTPPARAASKQSQLIALLQSPTGATIEQMTRATGWQAHTVRGTISGSLRKRLGLKVVCGGEAGAGVYRIVAAA
jgi:hypothetical protein